MLLEGLEIPMQFALDIQGHVVNCETLPLRTNIAHCQDNRAPWRSLGTRNSAFSTSLPTKNFPSNPFAERTHPPLLSAPWIQLGKNR